MTPSLLRWSRCEPVSHLLTSSPFTTFLLLFFASSSLAVPIIYDMVPRLSNPLANDGFSAIGDPVSTPFHDDGGWINFGPDVNSNNDRPSGPSHDAKPSGISTVPPEVPLPPGASQIGETTDPDSNASDLRIEEPKNQRVQESSRVDSATLEQWYDQKWVSLATWALAMYAVGSTVVFIWMWAIGCLHRDREVYIVPLCHTFQCAVYCGTFSKAKY